VVGAQDRAKDLLGGVDKRLAELQPKVDAKWPRGLRVSYVRMSSTDGGATTLNTSNPEFTGSAGRTLRQVRGLTVTGDNPTPTGVTLSPERMREIDADVILYFAGGGGQHARANEFLAAATSNPLWQSLEAVKAGRAHRVDTFVWFDGSGTTAANLAVDDMLKYLT